MTVGNFWGSLAKKPTPEVSALFSHNFNTGIGRFGFLANVAYDKIDQRDNAISVVDFQRRCNGCTLPGYRPDSYPGLAPGQYAYVPLGGDFRVQNESTARFGHVLAAQWENPDQSIKATLQWVGAADTKITNERTLQSATDGCAFGSLAVCGIPLAGTSPVYDSNGVLTSGTITALPTGSSFLPLDYGGLQTENNSTGYKSRNVTNDYSMHISWDVNQRLHLSADGQYTKSQYDYLYYYVRAVTNANWNVKLHGNGVPSLTLLSPDPNETRAQYFANPNNYYWAAAQDAYRHSYGNQRAFRLDGTFDVNADFVDNIKFGYRYSHQRETLQNSNFNYQPLSSPYGLNAVTFADTPGLTSPFNLNLNAFGGKGNTGIVAPYFALNPILQFAQSISAVRKINDKYFALNPGAYLGNHYYTNYQRQGLVPGTNYLPQEIDSNQERLNSAYVQLNFGNDNVDFLSNFQISGNIGLRYVHTQDNASGFAILPNLQLALNGNSIAAYCKIITNGKTAPAGTLCALPSAEQQKYLKFADGSYTPLTTSNSYGDWLPSFNLAIGWTNNLITRFAFSDAIYRPSLVQLQAGNFITGFVPLGTHGSKVPTLTDGYTGSNPYLTPIKSQNFDISQEWYFGNSGLLAATLFWKNLNDTIQYKSNVVTTTVTHNGVTYPEQLVAGLVNLKQKGNIHGIELQYQQHGFLPGWLRHFGINTNYTYIKPVGLHFGLSHYCPASYAPATQCVDQQKLPPIELSRDSLNLAIFYGDGPLSARVGWNWRSAFLVSGQEADYPFLPVMASAQGQVDASVSYKFSKHFKLSLQAANIANGTHKTRAIVNTAGLQVPKGYFRDDTRYSLQLSYHL